MQPVEISEGVGQVSGSEGMTGRGFILTGVGSVMSVYQPRSSETVCECYCYIFSTYRPAPLGEFMEWLFVWVVSLLADILFQDIF